MAASTSSYTVSIDPVSSGTTGESNNIVVTAVQAQEPNGPKSATLQMTAVQVGALMQYIAKIAAAVNTGAVETAIWGL